MKSILFLLTAGSLSAALPSVGPDYTRPDAAAPVAYRDATESGAPLWKTASPADTTQRGEWWKLFADPVLDELQGRALAHNQDLKAAAARVEQAYALAGVARSTYWPQVGAGGSFERTETSRTSPNALPQSPTTVYRAPLSATWELDLFGRVRRLSESARAEAQGSEATFEAVRLALTAEVASSYFTLRALHDERALLNDAVALRQRALELVNTRRQNGSAADLDSARAETELALAQAELAERENRRAAVQHALAVLVGESATDFELPSSPAIVDAPVLPAGLPSELLERRPDVAAAERAMAAANARVGVAKAAFFPTISLTGAAGYASGEMDTLFKTDSRAWSIGPSVYLPLFQGGRNRANLARSRAAYEEAVATYRGSVLQAFREVQDALTATRFLTAQLEAQNRAVAAAQRAAALAQVRYDAGYVSYLDVIDAQRTLLDTQQATRQLTAQRLNASVALIKALGGGWTNPSSERAVAQR